MSQYSTELLEQAAALRALAEQLRNNLQHVKSNPLDMNLMLTQVTTLTEYVYGLMHSRADDLEKEVALNKDDHK